ncbi:MAG: NAD(P)-dependent oxidoreductase [Desulfovibrionaceae bacterium]|nr:NAD(P)-dependent oxidoreductase [Desulfovibrionaceae bacterium]MBF0512638.1 NAD(P)-dependent oxidoreductase [Desulfovibrionaceae bacterium]
MRALLTGAGGFCGRRLRARLGELGHETFTMGLGPGLAASHVRLRSVTDLAAMRGAVARIRPDAVFHLAGTRDADPGVLTAVNEDYARALLTSLAQAEISGCRVVVFGSAAEYGDVPADRLPVAEDEPCRPATAYGASKLRQTEAALAMKDSGLCVVVARPFNVIGPGLSEELALGRFAARIAAIARGECEPVVHTRDLGGSRDFIDVRDVAELALKLALAPAAAGQIVNLCTGVETPVRAALTHMLRLAGASAVIREQCPPETAGTGCNAGRSAGSTRKLAALTGEHPYLDFTQTLRDMLGAAARGTCGLV